ncbi:PAS domain-containing sensor histidine kinase [Flavobacterium sp. PL002]|uniref:PAS domain-containing sensor histidine kinase n=1 Tax=Flavobacterium sp. PL002 TaxID=1897058 RepID=UPI00178855B6|nr:PAS domain-containing sensor histidine kinase [Flavobacterium sp. PL002]MBE0392274.1 Phytochrome-like protein cph1 [Flavobacterium sp. PL002]
MIRSNQKIADQEIDTFIKFKQFFELSPDLLCVAGFDGYFKQINPAVSNLLGYSQEELLAKPISFFVHHEDKKTTINAQNDLKNKIPLLNFENRYLTKNGTTIWLLWTSLPIESDSHVYAIAKNITYQKELEKERNQNLTDLININNNFKKLTYTAAHDLRSPVNNLLTIFDLLETDTINDPETAEFITLLKTTSLNLKDTLNEYVTMLDKQNEINEHLEEVHFQETLEDTVLSINALIENSQAKIDCNFTELKCIAFNKSNLKSIFLNLITNAIKYANPDYLPRISIFSKTSDDQKQLIVTDNGIGFDMEVVKDKIFGLHQKFHDHEDSKGIGLYLVHNHITSLGGNITVDSKVNHGTTFTITFKD